MPWKKRRLAEINSDIGEAKALRAENDETRQRIADAEKFVTTVARRRTKDGFGEELQISFTRRSA